MARKLLFLLFTDEPCRQNHALLYALDLHRQGHAVKLVVEGLATQALAQLDEPASRFAELFAELQQAGVLVGACERACSGCASNDPKRKVAEVASEHGVALLRDLEGHAGIERFVRDGYEIVVF